MGNKKINVVLHMCFEMDKENDVCRSLIVASDKTDIDKWKKVQRDDYAEGDKLASSSKELESNSLKEKMESTRKTLLMICRNS